MSLPAVSFPKLAVNSSLQVEVKKRYAAAPYSCFQLDVAFAAQPGVTILLGHSGAGKTTLLRSIAGLCDPEKGRIAIADRVLFDSEKKIYVEPAKRKVAFVTGAGTGIGRATAQALAHLHCGILLKRRGHVAPRSNGV